MDIFAIFANFLGLSNVSWSGGKIQKIDGVKGGMAPYTPSRGPKFTI